MAQKLQPFIAGLEKNNFDWTEECDKTFESIKQELTSEKILVYFDPDKQLILTCDASPYGIGAVLAHNDKSEFDHPIR